MIIKKKQITNKTILLTAVIGSLLVMSMVTVFSLWTSRQTLSATDEAVSAVSSFYLETMADRRARTVTNQINNDFSQMEKAVEFLKNERITTQEQLRETLGSIKTLLSLHRFALVDEENVVYTQYTTYTGGSRHEFLTRDTMEDRMISTVTLYGSSKQLCLAVPTPNLSIMGKSFKACFIQVDITEFVNLLAPDEQDRTYFGLYTKAGENLSDTELGPVISKQNFFEATKNLVSEDIWKENVSNFQNEQRGSMTFTSDGIKETLCYVPIQGPGWELVISIRESIILDQIRGISEKNLATSRTQLIFTFTSVLLLAIILLMQFRTVSKAKLEKEKETSRTFRTMANTDSMTGVKNKLAYSELESSYNKQIEAHEIQELAVVMCDINGLKFVNDTLGHAAGDQLIKDACDLICSHFTQGTVFRIGGDEFIVFLQGKDCETMHEVIHAFNRRVEENLKDDDVVVSLGFSVLTPEDQSVSTIFRRAERMMYKRKEELKALGAETR